MSDRDSNKPAKGSSTLLTEELEASRRERREAAELASKERLAALEADKERDQSVMRSYRLVVAALSGLLVIALFIIGAGVYQIAITGGLEGIGTLGASPVEATPPVKE